ISEPGPDLIARSLKEAALLTPTTIPAAVVRLTVSALITSLIVRLAVSALITSLIVRLAIALVLFKTGGFVTFIRIAVIPAAAPPPVRFAVISALAGAVS